MLDEQVETPEPESGTPPVPPPSAPGTATPAPDTDALVKAAAEKARREAQAAKDREVAALHRHYQNQLKVTKQAARARLTDLGDENVDAWEQYAERDEKAAAYDAMQAEAALLAESQRMANDIADTFGLKGDDPRLSGAQTWDEFRTKAKSAAAQDARAEREREAAEERDKQRKQADARLASGELDTLSPGVSVGTPDQATVLEREYRAKLKTMQGDVDRIAKLQLEYRRKGLRL